MLLEPRVEGRNAHATNFEIYFKDPFLAYVYVASIPFFVAGMYQGFRVLGFAGRNKVFSQEAVRALRTIKYCAMAVVGFVVRAQLSSSWFTAQTTAQGGVFMCILVTFGSVVIATAAATFERILQNAVDMKSENDLTV